MQTKHETNASRSGVKDKGRVRLQFQVLTGGWEGEWAGSGGCVPARGAASKALSKGRGYFHGPPV